MTEEKGKAVSTVALKTDQAPYLELLARSFPPLRKNSVGALAVQSLERYFWLLHLGRLELLEGFTTEELEILSEFLRREVQLTELRQLWSYFDTLNRDFARRLRLLSPNALLALLDATELRWRNSDSYPSLKAALGSLLEVRSAQN